MYRFFSCHGAIGLWKPKKPTLLMLLLKLSGSLSIIVSKFNTNVCQTPSWEILQIKCPNNLHRVQHARKECHYDKHHRRMMGGQTLCMLFLFLCRVLPSAHDDVDAPQNLRAAAPPWQPSPGAPAHARNFCNYFHFTSLLPCASSLVRSRRSSLLCSTSCAPVHLSHAVTRRAVE